MLGVSAALPEPVVAVTGKLVLVPDMLVPAAVGAVLLVDNVYS